MNDAPLKWKKISRDDYETPNGRLVIVERSNATAIPGHLPPIDTKSQHYVLLERVDVFSTLEDAKDAAEQLACEWDYEEV